MQSNGQFCAGNPTPPTEHATGPVWCTYPPPDRQIPPENIFMESCQQFEAQPVDVVHDSQVPPTLSPTLAQGASVESLPTLTYHRAVPNTPEPFKTGLNSPSMPSEPQAEVPVVPPALPQQQLSPPKKWRNGKNQLQRMLGLPRLLSQRLMSRFHKRQFLPSKGIPCIGGLVQSAASIELFSCVWNPLNMV